MAIEYKIKIENEVVGIEKIDVESTEKTQNKLVKESSKGSVTKLVAVQAAKQAAQFAVSNYGNLTGDMLGQSNINAGIEVAGLIGMMATGPLGIAAAIGTVGLKLASREIDVAKSRRASAAMMTRVGITISNSR